MSSKKITLIRHANPKGDSDPVLSDTGRKQASELSGHYQLVVVGSLRRQLDTYINSDIRADRVVISELLREQRMGDNLYNYYRCETIKGESKDDVMKRVETLKIWLLEQPETSICLVTSAFFMCYFLDSCKVTRHLIGYCQRFDLTLDA